MGTPSKTPRRDTIPYVGARSSYRRFSIPIEISWDIHVGVAIASGDKHHIEKVREAQLGIDMPNVVCVDAKGLPLNEDHLHLSTEAQVLLGNMLAQAYIKHFMTPYN